MQDRVEEAIGDDPDVVLLVLNARERIGAGDRYVARRVFELGAPVIIALNKVDRLKPGHIASQMKVAAGLGDFHALHPVSGKLGDGIDELRSDLVSLLPEGPLYYPDGELTDMPPRPPHSRARPGAGARADAGGGAPRAHGRSGRDRRGHVHVRLYTETESQKQILIGKGGSMVREIGRSARPGIEALLGREIYLELQVKASPRWRRNETMLERLGL